MNDEKLRAEEQLRVIRSLVERATVYHAISAPISLIGGLSALGVSGYLLSKGGYFSSAETSETALSTRSFMMPWLGALLITKAAGFFFVSREAVRRQRPFFSPEMRLALRSITPSILVAAVITLVIWRNPVALDGPTFLALTWTLFYGLALLATIQFAPRPVVLLGAAFVFVAVIWFVLLSSPALMEVDAARRYLDARVVMTLTFGVFHVIYAACTWTRARKARDVAQ